MAPPFEIAVQPDGRRSSLTGSEISRVAFADMGAKGAPVISDQVLIREAGGDRYYATLGNLPVGAGQVDTAELVDEAVTLAKLQHIAEDRVLGRVSSGSGDPEELTAAQLRALLACEYVDVYDTTGGTNISLGTPAKVTLDTVRKNSNGSVFSLSSNELTIDKTATFKVTFYGTAEEGADSRAAAEFWVMHHDGVSWSDVADTRALSYVRQVSNASIATRAFLIDITSGDKLKLMAERTKGSASLTTRADFSGMVVEEML